jgi:hypothetical protein
LFHKEVAWYLTYSKIRTGMSLRDVEFVLGPGKQIGPEAIQTIDYDENDPANRVHSVVQGDERYIWQTRDHFLLVVGFKNGAVADKWYSIPMP